MQVNYTHVHSIVKGSLIIHAAFQPKRCGEERGKKSYQTSSHNLFCSKTNLFLSRVHTKWVHVLHAEQEVPPQPQPWQFFSDSDGIRNAGHRTAERPPGCECRCRLWKAGSPGCWCTWIPVHDAETGKTLSDHEIIRCKLLFGRTILRTCAHTHTRIVVPWTHKYTIHNLQHVVMSYKCHALLKTEA